MPKIGKNHLIKKLKLVKTTTFLTLLIAATFIFSSIAPATMVSNDVNIINENITEPLIAGDSSGLFGPDPGEPEINIAFEKPIEYEGSTRGIVVWDNGMSFSTICASQEDTVYGLDSHQADDFIFADDTEVHDVHWVAGYWNGYTTASPWGIKFYEDDGTGTSPGDLFAGPFIIDWDDIAKVSLGGEYWEYSCNIDEVVFSGGEKYWIDIWGELDLYPQCGWGAHYYTYIMNPAVWGSDYFGFPYWTPGIDVLGVEFDMAFQLTQKPDHDVLVSDIISPVDGQDLCGCLPVVIEVENMGLVDESDVPVFVEIRRTIFYDSFEDPMGFVWDIMGVDCGWNLVGIETGYPAYVTPRTGYQMAELNSGCGGAGGSCMLYEIEWENLEDYCEPAMSFWMWHDTYGSDDYLEVWVDPGTGWQFVAGPYYRLCCPGCPQGWKQHSVSLGAFAGLSFVRIGFKGYCDGNPSAYGILIDDVEKYDQEYYAETTVDIAVGETVEIEFDEEWCPCLWGEVFNTYLTFEILACTALDIDQNPANDCMSDFITLYFPFEIDIAAISIDEPTDPVAGPNPMKGTIKNVGQTEQCCFKAKMSVRQLSKFSMEEDFDEWEDNPENPIGYIYDDRPVNWRDYLTLYYYDYGWEDWSTNNAGGTAPEACLYYGYANYYSDNNLESPSMNTLGYDILTLEYKSYIDWYYGSTYCSMYVEIWDGCTWNDITPWSNPISGNVGPATYTHDITGFESSDMKVRFRFYGYYYYFDYWYVDDFKVIGTTIGDVEYYEEVCVDCIDVCEEQQLTFPDWTPAQPWPDCATQSYLICLEVNPCDPIDQNPLNNKVCTEVDVEFYRDVLVKALTGPCPATSKGAIIFEQPLTDPSGSWSFWTSDVSWGYLVMDDFYGLTDMIGPIEWYGLTAIPGVWTPCDPAGMEFQIIYYEDDGGLPGAVLATHDLTDTDYTYEATGDSYSGIPAYHWMADIPCINLETGWISIQSTYSPTTDCAFIWGNSPVGNNNAMQNGGNLADNTAFTLTACEGGPPPVDCFIGCGEAEISGIIENAGTHDEVVDIFFELWEWVTDPDVGTFVTSGSISNVAIASGDTYEASFGTYDFAEPGIYGIVIQAPLAGDCDPDNNEEFYGIGVDCCYPHSCHMPDPQYPNGENNWYTRSVDVTIEAFDPLCPDPCLGTASGIAEIHYIINSGSEVIVPDDNAEFKLTDDGVHLVEYWAVDNAGNAEPPFTFEIAIDKTDPTVTLFYTAYQEETGGWKVDFTAAVGEATSGVNRVEFYIGSTLDSTVTTAPYTWTIDWQKDYKSVTFYAKAFDNAGNEGEDSVEGRDIAKDINAKVRSHEYLISAHPRVILNQQPLSR